MAVGCEQYMQQQTVTVQLVFIRLFHSVCRFALYLLWWLGAIFLIKNIENTVCKGSPQNSVTWISAVDLCSAAKWSMV